MAGKAHGCDHEGVLSGPLHWLLDIYKVIGIAILAETLHWCSIQHILMSQKLHTSVSHIFLLRNM